MELRLKRNHLSLAEPGEQHWQASSRLVCCPDFALFLTIAEPWRESWSFYPHFGLNLRQIEFITGKKVEIFGCELPVRLKADYFPSRKQTPAY